MYFSTVLFFYLQPATNPSAKTFYAAFQRLYLLILTCTGISDCVMAFLTQRDISY